MSTSSAANCSIETNVPAVRDGNVTLDITLLRPPTPGSSPPPPVGGEFLSWWRNECRIRNLPAPRFAGADRKIASRLASKHGIQRLKTLAVNYFRRHNEGEKRTFEMVHFSRRIPLIETELKEQAS